MLADEQRLRQVLLNLLTNGVKFNQTHGRVTVSCHVVFDAMVIRVRDTGFGIATADIGQIFMPFERLDADRRGIEGAGVGLALAKRLTEAMGGAIGVESERGNGSTFFLVLRTTGPGSAVVEAPPPVTRSGWPSSCAAPTPAGGGCCTSRTTRTAAPSWSASPRCTAGST